MQQFDFLGFMLRCICTLNLRVHSILTMYEKNLVKVSVRENFGVVMNSFGQFHSTFIRYHSRFFVRVGYVTTFMYVLQSIYLYIQWKSFFFQLYHHEFGGKNNQFTTPPHKSDLFKKLFFGKKLKVLLILKFLWHYKCK